jgi:hypothetical protein
MAIASVSTDHGPSLPTTVLTAVSNPEHKQIKFDESLNIEDRVAAC